LVSAVLLIASLLLPGLAFNVSWTLEHSLTLPSPRSSPLACHVNGTLYVMGGRQNLSHSLDDIYVYNSTNQTFLKLPISLPQSAYFVSNYMCLDRFIYMVGVGTSDIDRDAYVWIFDTITYNFTSVTLPDNVDAVSLPCVVHSEQQQSLFIIGGLMNYGNASHASQQMLQFNYSTQQFVNASFAEMPSGVYGAMCAMVNGTAMNGTTSEAPHAVIYVFGGEPADTTNDSIVVDRRQIYQYNLTENVWTDLSATANIRLTQPRSFGRAIYDERANIILLIGAASPWNRTLFTDSTDIFYVHNYSVLTAFGDRLPYKLEFNTVSREGDYVYVWGGYREVSIQNDTAVVYNDSDKVFKFALPKSEKSHTWTILAIIAGFCGLAVIGGFLAYCLCGRSDASIADEYDGAEYERQKDEE